MFDYFYQMMRTTHFVRTRKISIYINTKTLHLETKVKTVNALQYILCCK